MSVAFGLELLAVALGIVYVLLAAREDVRCWPFGIAGSAIGVYLFLGARLYSESLLHVTYVILGIVGWWTWTGQGRGEALSIQVWPLWKHGLGLLGVMIGTLLLGGAFGAWTDAAMPYVDAFTTSASLFTTWLTARKLLWNWTWWVVIDAVSTVMYASRELYAYSALMAAYTVIAVFAQVRWARQVRGGATAP